MAQMWKTQLVEHDPTRKEVHVYPVPDAIPHDLTQTCWCGAEVRQEPESWPMVIHRIVSDDTIMVSYGA